MGSGAPRLAPHAVEVRGAAHVGGRVVPSERVARLAAERLASAASPSYRPRVPVVVQVACHACSATSAAISSSVGQMSARCTGVPCASRAQRVVLQVHVHRARQRVGDRPWQAQPGSSATRRARCAPRSCGCPESTLASSMSSRHVVQLVAGWDPSCRCSSCSRTRTCRSPAPAAPSMQPRALQQKLSGLAARGEHASSPTAWRAKPRVGGVACATRPRGEHHGGIGRGRAARSPPRWPARRASARTRSPSHLDLAPRVSRSRPRSAHDRVERAPAPRAAADAVVRARTGPATLARRRCARSSSITSGVRARGRVRGSCQKPCALAYGLDERDLLRSLRPVRRR